MKEVYKLPLTKNPQDKENKIRAYDKFIQLNPDSKYIEIALNHSSIIKNISGVNYDSTFILQVEDFLEKNPESLLSEALIYYSADIIRKKYGGVESAHSYLESIKNKFPNTHAFFGAENLIKTKMYTQDKKGN